MAGTSGPSGCVSGYEGRSVVKPRPLRGSIGSVGLVSPSPWFHLSCISVLATQKRLHPCILLPLLQPTYYSLLPFTLLSSSPSSTRSSFTIPPTQEYPLTLLPRTPSAIPFLPLPNTQMTLSIHRLTAPYHILIYPFILFHLFSLSYH